MEKELFGGGPQREEVVVLGQLRETVVCGGVVEQDRGPPEDGEVGWKRVGRKGRCSGQRVAQRRGKLAGDDMGEADGSVSDWWVRG